MDNKMYKDQDIFEDNNRGILPIDTLHSLDDSLLSEASIELEEDIDTDLVDSVMNSESTFIFRTSMQGKLQDSLNSYIQTIASFPQLSPEELSELMIRAKQEHDKEAMLIIVSHHLRLVVWIAMTFQRRWHQNLQDLIQEGNLGLLRALDKFDPGKGIKFSYYATFWIKAYILKFLMTNWRLVKIGTTQTQRKLFYTLNREKQKLIAMGFEADTKLLAQHFEVSEEEIIDMQQRLEGVDVSVNTDSSDEGNTVIQITNGQSAEDILAKEELSEKFGGHIEELFTTLNPNEQRILRERILSDSPTTLKVLGEELNISRERVRQIESRLIEKIKKHLDSRLINLSQEWFL